MTLKVVTEAKAILVWLLLCASAVDVQALGLGRLQGAAQIGRPLDVSVQIQIDPGEDITALCLDVEIYHADVRQDRSLIRVTLDAASAVRLTSARIESLNTVDETVVTVLLRAGCTQKTTRRYVLLADPQPEVVAPVSAPAALPKGTIADTPLHQFPTTNQTGRVPASPEVIKDCADCPEMVVIPAGSFLMGSPVDPPEDPFSNDPVKKNGEPNERPQHLVQVRSFAIGKYEVTQEQWYAVMGSNPSNNKGRKLPVEQVSWNDAQQFIAKLNQKTGKRYRLPSEAEWEYAARAGSTTKWSFGDDESELLDYAWGGFSVFNTQEVGQKLRNEFGLFDMHGNVWEWTQDCWHENYSGAPADGSAWIINCIGIGRVLRGGSWRIDPTGLRSAGRFRFTPDYRDYSFGLRLARTLTP